MCSEVKSRGKEFTQKRISLVKDIEAKEDKIQICGVYLKTKTRLTKRM